MPKKRHLTWSNATCCNRDDVILLVKNHTDSVRFFVLVDSINPVSKKTSHHANINTPFAQREKTFRFH